MPLLLPSRKLLTLLMKPFKPWSQSIATSATAGFTLLEMLVVVIIIGVLASIAAPDWFQYLMGRRVVTVRDEVRQVLEEAQNTAITRREQRVVTFYTSEDLPTVSIGSTHNDGARQTLGGDSVRPGMITLSATSDSVTFDYQGTVESSPITITVTPTGQAGGRKSCVVLRTLLGSLTNEDGSSCP
jgi:prepilin-type N-terminal cleavage/methylation domain-containing protein